MKTFKILFIVIAVLTGLAGFAGVLFFDIQALRSLTLLYTVLLVFSLGLNLFLAGSRRVRLRRVKK